MIDTQYLEEIIASSGKKKSHLASKCGITRQSLSNKIHNRSDFTVEEVSVLCDELNITRLTDKDRIFFASGLKKMETN